MTTIRVLKGSDAVRRPWKNGRGETLQLAIWPSGAELERGDFAFRISRASVVEAGPFSHFPGCDRTLVLLDGDGLDLEHGHVAPAIRLQALVPYPFSGDADTSARLVGRSVNDFNVITTRGRARVVTCHVVARTASISLAADHVFVHVVTGEARVTHADSYALQPLDTLWVHGHDRVTSLVVAEASFDMVMIVVRIEAPSDAVRDSKR